VPAVISRSLTDDTDNLITLISVKIRLQICGGLPDELGIARAQWVLLFEGTQIDSGTTTANGEIEIIMLPAEELTLRVFDTDYPIHLRDAYLAANTLGGQQKRFDTLGYIVGYLGAPIGAAVPDDGADGPRTRQAVLQFQTDETLGIDSVAGNTTQASLTTRAGA
jgi:peptidoglycan hydrolase-like protein with peptidoglycan-binding domain